jgi:hypothetical protein
MGKSNFSTFCNFKELDVAKRSRIKLARDKAISRCIWYIIKRGGRISDEIGVEKTLILPMQTQPEPSSRAKIAVHVAWL